MEGEKVLHVHYQGGLRKCWFEAQHLHERSRLVRGTSRLVYN
jgi:hypothetical protein